MLIRATARERQTPLSRLHFSKKTFSSSASASATMPPPSPSFFPFCLLTSAFVYLDKYSVSSPYSFNAQTRPLLQKYEHCLRCCDSNRLSSDEDVLFFFRVFFVFFIFFFSFFLLSGRSEFFFEDGDAKIVVVSDFADETKEEDFCAHERGFIFTTCARGCWCGDDWCDRRRSNRGSV